MTTFERGDWLRWTTHDIAKEGEVVRVDGPSLVVRWMSGERQVFPIYEQYVPPRAAGEGRMVHIERPREASRIERDRRRGVMSVRRAAATLGVSPKRVRAMLRSGQLRGVQTDGKWTHVEL